MNMVAHFITCDYMKGNRIFFMVLKNNKDKILVVTDIIMKS